MIERVIETLEENELAHFKGIKQLATMIDPQIFIDKGIPEEIAHLLVD